MAGSDDRPHPLPPPPAASTPAAGRDERLRIHTLKPVSYIDAHMVLKTGNTGHEGIPSFQPDARRQPAILRYEAVLGLLRDCKLTCCEWYIHLLARVPLNGRHTTCNAQAWVAGTNSQALPGASFPCVVLIVGSRPIP